MKSMKKLMALLMTMAMLLVMGTTAFAAGNDGSITLANATVGETYKIYKVFDLTYATQGAAPSTTTNVAYTYTMTSDTDQLFTALNDAGSPFTLTETVTANVYSVALKEGKNADDVSTFLKTNANKLTEITGKAAQGLDGSSVATAQTVKWENLDYGYYYITSSLGSTVTIDSTLKDVEIEDKNSVPTQDKKQATGTTAPGTADGYVDDEQQVQVGDKVWYQIEVTDGKGTNQAITITDTMTNGLTFNKDITVMSKSATGVDEQAVDTNNYTKTDGQTSDDFTFKVVLKADYVSTLNENDKVYIRFSATVNTLAASESGATTETNTSKLDYSNQSTTDTVTVTTYKFQLDKVKSDNTDLLGAKFELYRGTKANGNKVWFVKGTADNGTPVLIVVGHGANAPAGTNDAFSEIQLISGTEGSSLGSSKVIIKGLDKETYVLHETEAPQGYNLLAEDTTIAQATLLAINGTITDNEGTQTDSGVVSVVNKTGTELPETGGIGTTIFYVVGGILVLGAAIFFIVRRRMRADGKASE